MKSSMIEFLRLVRGSVTGEGLVDAFLKLHEPFALREDHR
jgi:hypothetical protein